MKSHINDIDLDLCLEVV